MNNNELIHYGILGMRWGQRKAGEGNARTKKKTNSIDDLSDDDLTTRIKRLSLETRYSELKVKQNQMNAGESTVQKLMRVGGTLAAASTTAITLYQNGEKIKKILEPMLKQKS